MELDIGSEKYDCRKYGTCPQQCIDTPSMAKLLGCTPETWPYFGPKTPEQLEFEKMFREMNKESERVFRENGRGKENIRKGS